ncbi:hypothetical protein O181_020153 [Austropuccinia psidii MF-1]|uniref:Uncharacterized protein n=1 Tax=Austropuccinia psidii MF-1 TaxID=1389203 RepID=A0A9Q3CAX6_9BASI|nr:hypothetical protein [Austropuccinia psidii MF-1]
MEDARASTSSQRLSSTFETLIESQEAGITAIPVVTPDLFPAGRNREIPVSVQELVYGGKKAGVGTSAKSLNRNNELLYSRTSPIDKSLAENPKHVIRGPEEEVVPGKGKQPCGSYPSLHKQKYASTSSTKGKANPKEQSKGQSQSGTNPTHRITGFQRKIRQRWTMC